MSIPCNFHSLVTIYLQRLAKNEWINKTNHVNKNWDDHAFVNQIAFRRSKIAKVVGI